MTIGGALAGSILIGLVRAFGSIGFPLVGDSVYGKQHLAHLFPRQALHAERLTLVHPSTGEECTWQAALPPDMADLLQRAAISA